MNTASILVVDDDASVRNLYASILRQQSYDVALVSSGSEGLVFLSGREVDLIILDLQMPQMDGFEFLERLKKQSAQTPPVIISTGYGTIENAVKAIKMGAADFVVKPFSIPNLLQTVERSLMIRTLSREVTDLRMVQSILDLNQVVMSLTEMDPLLEKIVAILWDLFSPESIFLYLASETGESFILRKQKQRGRNVLSGRVSFTSEEVAGMFQDGETRQTAKNGRIELSALIKGKEKKIGFLLFGFGQERQEISSREVKFVSAFVSQAGIGIENARLFEELSNAYMNTIRSLVNSLEAKDTYTKGHSEQVAYYALLIGKQLGLGEKELQMLKNVGYLHDLGKLGIKDSILLKEGPLEREEIEIIRRHPVITAEILEPLDLDRDEFEACLFHHERINGKGYPHGLKAQEIPLFARIVAVADAYSAMISERPYSKKKTREEAVAELRMNSGSQFDGNIVEVFVTALSLLDQVREKGMGPPTPSTVPI